MIVFKTYFKILAKHKIAVAINFIIFLAISVLFSMNVDSYDTGSFNQNSMKHIDVGVIRNDDSVRNDGLVSYLEDTFEVIEIENDEIAIKNALFFAQVNYVLIIDENDYQSYQVPNSSVGHIVEGSINNFLNTFDAIESANPNMDASEITILTKENIENDIDVVLNNTGDRVGYLGNFYNMFVYGILGTVMMGIGVVMMVFNENKIYDRTIIASTKINKRNIYLNFSNILFALCVWVVAIAVSVMVSGVALDNINLLMFMINSLTFTFVACALAYVITQLIKKVVVLAAVISVLSLGLSFISGAFVPQFLLGDLTLNIAKFTPAYWYISNNDLIVSMQSFNLEPLMTSLLIQIGFAIAFIAIGLAISKYKLERK